MVKWHTVFIINKNKTKTDYLIILGSYIVLLFVREYFLVAFSSVFLLHTLTFRLRFTCTCTGMVVVPNFVRILILIFVLVHIIITVVSFCCCCR